MSNATQISLSQYTWALWKREAVAARDRAKKTAWFVFGVVTVAVALAGASQVEGTWRYSVVVYAPIAGLIFFEPTTRAVMRRTFRATGEAMRYRLVPALVSHATDAELAELASQDRVTIRQVTLRAVDTGKEVIVSTGPTSPSWTDGYLVVDDLADGGHPGGSDGGGGWSDGGGGFGGGGGGDGGGGG